jgi:electron transfer flavoprotein beta subunit
VIKIVVTIKQILDPTGFSVNRKHEKVFVNREEYVVNPADLNALEMALCLKDGRPDVEVIVLGLGPGRVDDALREAMARGADSGVLISDPALADLKTDAAGAARLMAAVLHRIGEVSLVICGAAALDSGAGELPGRLAEVLGWPMLAEVHSVDEMTSDRLRGARRADFGELSRAVRLEADLPALLTVPRGANQPRHMHGARAMTVYRTGQVLTWGLADLGLTPDELEPTTRVVGRRFPPERALGIRLEGSLDEAVHSLVAQLRANELI